MDSQSRYRSMFRRKYYMLEGNSLRPGDIILSGHKAKQSFIIRTFTWSKFSHAAIVLDGGLYAEAVGLGVRVRSVRTILKEKLKVLRLKPINSQLAQITAADAASAVWKYIHSQYWTSGAMLALFRSVEINKRNQLFCSHLVAKAYEDVGKKVIEDVSPEKTTPALLNNSTKLQDVSHSVVFRPAFFPSFLMSSDFETASDLEAVVVQSIYTDLAPWFITRRLQVPDDWVGMLRVLADIDSKDQQALLDKEMIDVMVKNGYFKIIQFVKDKCTIPMEKVFADIDRNEIPIEHVKMEYYLLEEALKSLQEQKSTNEDNESFFGEQYAKNGLGTFEMLALNSKTQAKMTERMIGLCIATMNSLYEKYLEEDA